MFISEVEDLKLKNSHIVFSGATKEANHLGECLASALEPAIFYEK